MPTIPGTREDDLLLLDERIAMLEYELASAKEKVIRTELHLATLRKSREMVATIEGYDD